MKNIVKINTTYLPILSFFAITTPINDTRPQLPGTFATLPPSPSPGNISQHYAFGDIQTLGEGLTRLVNPVFSIAATLVIIYFLIGSFKYLTSAGDKEAVAGARQMITHAIIGFMLLLFVFLVLQFLPEVFKFNLPILF